MRTNVRETSAGNESVLLAVPVDLLSSRVSASDFRPNLFIGREYSKNQELKGVYGKSKSFFQQELTGVVLASPTLRTVLRTL